MLHKLVHLILNNRWSIKLFCLCKVIRATKIDLSLSGLGFRDGGCGFIVCGCVRDGGCGFIVCGCVQPGCPFNNLVNHEVFLFTDGVAGLDHHHISLHTLLLLVMSEEHFTMANILHKNSPIASQIFFRSQLSLNSPSGHGGEGTSC